MIAVAAPAHLTAPQLTVDLSIIAHNVRTIVSRTGTPITAVVKADAFGHGTAQVARVAIASGASGLGVATLEEALALRATTDAPILAWLTHAIGDYDDAVRGGVEIAVPSIPHLEAVCRASRRTATVARVHLHVDTGMARDGAPRDQWLALSAAARRAERDGTARIVGLMSHLARGGEPGHPATADAVSRFREAAIIAHGVGLRPRKHLAATAAALTDPSTRFDMVRIGAGLYGIGIGTGIGAGLREALTLTAPVIAVRDVPAGTPVGYGHTHVTKRATRLALVPLGYGDGIPRLASAAGEVEIRGRRRRLAGLISMDQLVIDVGDLGVEAGETVTVFGGGGGRGGGNSNAPTIADWARWSQTIPHEVMTGLGARIQRSYR